MPKRGLYASTGCYLRKHRLHLGLHFPHGKVLLEASTRLNRPQPSRSKLQDVFGRLKGTQSAEQLGFYKPLNPKPLNPKPLIKPKE